MSAKKSYRENERSLSSQASSALGARLGASRSPFSRMHNIDGHSSVQRGSTAAALETDSDFSNESSGQCVAPKQKQAYSYSSFGEGKQSGRGRDTARDEGSGKNSHRAYASEAQEDALTGRESERSKERFHRSIHSMKAAMLELQRDREEEIANQQQSYQNTSSRIDNKWARREDPHFKLRRSVKHVIDPNRKSTPDLSNIMSRVDTGIKKLSGVPTPRDHTP